MTKKFILLSAAVGAVLFLGLDSNNAFASTSTAEIGKLPTAQTTYFQTHPMMLSRLTHSGKRNNQKQKPRVSHVNTKQNVGGGSSWSLDSCITHFKDCMEPVVNKKRKPSSAALKAAKGRCISKPYVLSNCHTHKTSSIQQGAMRQLRNEGYDF